MVPDRAAIALVAVLLTTAGCAGVLGSSGDGGDYATQVQQRSAAAMENVSTFHMQMTMEMDAGGQQMSVAYEGEYNRTSRKASAEMRTMGREVTMYIENQTTYMQLGDQWRARDIEGPSPWEDGRLARQRQILENSTVTFVENTTLDGEPVAVLRVEPSPEQIRTVVQQQQNQDLSGVSIENITYTQYVSRDTYRLRKFTMNATMSANGNTVDVTMTARFDRFDEPVTVTIPEAARNASSASQVRPAS